MTALFRRGCRVTIGGLAFEGSADGGGLRIDFKVTQSLTSRDNDATVKITNISPTSRTALTSVVRPQLIIEAGYEDRLGAIFAGRAAKVETAREGVDFVATAKAKEGTLEKTTIVNTALAPGATIAQVLEKIVAAMNANDPPGIPPLSGARVIADARAGKFNANVSGFANGVSLHGTAGELLDWLGRTCGFEWSIQGSELVALLPSQTTETLILLNPQSGLVGTPTRVVDAKRPRAFLVKARSLLQPGFRPGVRVRLQSAEVSGTFRVEHAEHEGDSRGSAWYSTVLMKEV